MEAGDLRNDAGVAGENVQQVARVHAPDVDLKVVAGRGNDQLARGVDAEAPQLGLLRANHRSEVAIPKI